MHVGLENQIIIITGAASGIGAAIAQAAADAGAAGLFLTDIDAAGLAQTAKGLPSQIVRTHIADLSNATAPQEIVAAAVAEFGQVDGLVNSAGLTTRGSILNGTAEVWDSLFAINAKAAFFLMQAVIHDMQRRKASGAIVNILSMNAHCGTPDLAIYAATKGALTTLTKNAASVHLPERIRVNGINLGWVNTPKEHHMQSVTLGHGDAWLAKATAGLPLGRLVDAAEAARLAVYLLSDVSTPMTGVAIDLEQRVTGAPF